MRLKFPIQSIILWVISALFLVAALGGINSSGDAVSIVITFVIALILALLGFRAHLHRNRIQQGTAAIIQHTFTHTTGLPVADGVKVKISVYNERVDFDSSGVNFNIERDRITDVSIKKETELQSHYTSSAGGAIAGAMLFGVLGAAIGGRSKVKETKKVRKFLIFTYTKEDEINYVAFDVTKDTFGKASTFKSRLSTSSGQIKKTVEL